MLPDIVELQYIKLTLLGIVELLHLELGLTRYGGVNTYQVDVYQIEWR